MVKDFIQNIGDKIETINRREENRPLIFLVCLLVASVLWLVNALGKNFETEVKMPIHYVNLPGNKVLLNPPPPMLTVRIEAHGFSLLRNRLKLSFYPINFNLKAFITYAEDNLHGIHNRYPLESKRFISYISKQIGPEISILEISPDTLFFEFDDVIDQKKPVKANLQLGFSEQFFLFDSLRYTPDSVRVKGPKSILDTLSVIGTKNRRIKNLNTTVKKSLELEVDPQLEVYPKRIDVVIPVSAYSEYTGKFPISVTNLPDSLNLITFPGSVQVSCLVAVPNYGNISASSFLFFVDYQELVSGKSALTVNPVHSPSFIQNLKFSPHEVEYIIERK